MSWPDAGPTLRCPVCGGPLAFWVVQARFRCHHCHAGLSSDHRRVQRACARIGLVAWVVTTFCLSRFGGLGLGEAALLGGQVLVPATLALGWLALKYRVRLVPLREPGAAAQPEPPQERLS